MFDVLTMLTTREDRRTQGIAEGAWDREARSLIAAAAAHGVTLREEDLIYCDVHDLQALLWRIEHNRDRWGHDRRGPRAA